MKVFISWSGEAGRRVAVALRGWLKDMLHGIDPWMSDQDLAPGAKWFSAIAGELENTDFGIICVTPDSAGQPWLLFEAGALAKRFSEARVIPYLYGLQKGDLAGPLAQFQALEATESDTFKLANEINRLFPALGVDDGRLRRSFTKWWPDLKRDLEAVPFQAQPATVTRDSRDIMMELLDTVRTLARERRPSDTEREFSKHEVEHWIRLSSGKPFDPIGLAIFSSILPSSLSWLGHISLDLYRELETGAAADPAGDLLRLKFLLETGITVVRPAPDKLAVLEIFSAYIMHLARSHFPGPVFEDEETEPAGRPSTMPES